MSVAPVAGVGSISAVRPGRARLGLSVVLRGGGAVLQLVTQAVIARFSGVVVLGIYNVFTSWVRVLGNVLALGLPQYTMRRVAARDAMGDVGHARHLVRRGLLVVASVGAGCAVLVSLGLLVASAFSSVSRWALVLAIVSASALFAALRILAEALKARSRPETALFLEYNAVPLVLAGAVALVFGLGGDVGSGLVVAVNVLALVAVVTTGLAVWSRLDLRVTGGVRGVPAETAPPVTDEEPFDRRSLATYAGISVLTVATWTLPILVLPFFVDLADIGRFGAAQRLVAVPTLVIVALSGHFAPLFARAAARRDPGSLATHLRRSQFLVGLAFTPTVLVFLVEPNLLLGFFGEEFGSAQGLVRVMAIGQLANAWTGLAPDLLMMTGHERLEFLSTGMAVAVMVVATIVGGLWFGMGGVAVGYAYALAQRNVTSYLFALNVIRRCRRSSPQDRRDGWR